MCVWLYQSNDPENVWVTSRGVVGNVPEETMQDDDDDDCDDDDDEV